MEVCFRPELGASGRLGNKARRTPLAELRNLDGLNGENVWNYPLIRNLVSNLQWQERLFSLSAIQVFLSLAAPTLGPWVLWPIFNISYRSPKMNRKVSRAVCIIYIYIYIITYSIQNTYIYTYRLCIYVYMYTTQRAVVPASFVDLHLCLRSAGEEGGRWGAGFRGRSHRRSAAGQLLAGEMVCK